MHNIRSALKKLLGCNFHTILVLLNVNGKNILIIFLQGFTD